IYNKLTQIYHPDTTELPQEHAQKKFEEITEAYQTLSDPVKRAAFDKMRQPVAVGVGEAYPPQPESLREAEAEGVTVCYRHPQTETGLRCNRCNKPICPKCAQRTPVGFRCPDCIREQEDKFYTGGNSDYFIAALIALPLSLIVALIFVFIIGGIGFFAWIISFFAAPFATGIIAEAVRWGVGKRRSRYLGRIVAGCLIGATVPFMAIFLFSGSFFSLIGPAILLFAGVPTILARLR
ncbi:MAG: DnaJ domain-containing protein, partial [Chloroflexota bacterium]